MADIELVIKIPEETYEYWETHKDEYVLAEAIKNGTLLPKVHGRLIDADALVVKGDVTESYLNIFAPTIIEADKSEREEV